jgi:hypothetical protein
METRKRRVYEQIDKHDAKAVPLAEKTPIVQIYDRRVKIEFCQNESILERTSLYSTLRAWVQDDPDKSHSAKIKNRKRRNQSSVASAKDPTYRISASPKRKIDDDSIKSLQLRKVSITSS